METLTATIENVFDSKSLDNETEFKTLVRSIKLSDGFSLFLARSNKISEQKKLAENLKEEFPKKNVKVIFIGKPIKHLLDEVRQVLANEKPFAVLLYGLNDSIPTDADSPKNIFIKNLNASRNSFPRIIDCPLVLFLPDFAISAIMRGAVDFFSARSDIFYFENKKGNINSQNGLIISKTNSEIGGLTLQERQERLNIIQDISKGVKDKKLQIKLLLSKGELYLFKAEYKKAETAFNLALELSERLNNLEFEGETYNSLAGLFQKQGRYKEAEPLHIKAIDIYVKLLGENHPTTATSYNNLAELYRIQGRYEEAEPLYIKAKDIYEKMLGENHSDTAASYNNLGGLYQTLRRYKEAELLFIKAKDIHEKILGKDHPYTATSYNNLAILYQTLGRYEEAEPLYIKAKDIRKTVLGENHPDTASVDNNLAGLYYLQGRYEEVEPLYKQALAICEKVLGENHPDTAESYMNLGAFYYERGKSQDALELCEKALRIYQNTLPVGHPSIQNCAGWVEIIKNSMGK